MYNFFTSLNEFDLESIPIELKNKYIDQIYQGAGLKRPRFLEERIGVLSRILEHLSGEQSFTEAELLGYKADKLAKEKNGQKHRNVLIRV